jgi:2-polyprenyl-3-methyl-5-hydroxy-6-metoxy-1,4-benzoquinol methylase
MIKRLKPKWSDKELEKVYDHQYDHTSFDDHVLRVKHTIQFVRDNLPMNKNMLTVADLSAGDGAIANGLPFPNKILGDYYPGFEYTGKIEDTIEQIPNVDLFVLSETLEHVDNPLEVLKQIRNKTNYLLVSTPQDNWEDDNPEHYWAWDKDGVEGLLKDAGFEPIAFLSETLWYTHQYWICK